MDDNQIQLKTQKRTENILTKKERTKRWIVSIRIVVLIGILGGILTSILAAIFTFAFISIIELFVELSEMLEGAIIAASIAAGFSLIAIIIKLLVTVKNERKKYIQQKRLWRKHLDIYLTQTTSVEYCCCEKHNPSIKA